MRAAWVMMLVTALSAGCAQEAQISEREALRAEELGVLGAQIRRAPERAETILAQHDLNLERFEDAIRDVAADPEASRRYWAAYQQAGGAAVR